MILIFRLICEKILRGFYKRHAKWPDALCISIRKKRNVLFSFLSDNRGTPAGSFGTVLDLDRVSLRAEVVGTHTCALYRVYIRRYTRARGIFARNGEPWLHFRGTCAASQSTFKGPTDVFPVLSKSSYSSRVRIIPDWNSWRHRE